MALQPHLKERAIYAERWAAYVSYGVDTTATSPIAVMVYARTEEGAQQIAAAVAEGNIGISRKWWRFGRRWQLMAKTRPLALNRESVDQWFEGLLVLLEQHDAEFVHWVPLPAA